MRAFTSGSSQAARAAGWPPVSGNSRRCTGSDISLRRCARTASATPGSPRRRRDTARPVPPSTLPGRPPGVQAGASWKARGPWFPAWEL
ncbi:hypothetical protein [Thermocatellispora tengchongensis]|uniref:hypothetical protein n=1 Tax=Thermocatellispora tengchongensis TaxID=1073253 RepID=UPI003637EC43